MSEENPAGTPWARRYGPWALVTGASEGIGAALARQLAERGVNVVLTARNRKRLETIAHSIRTDTRAQAETAVLDLLEADAAARLVSACAGKDIGLVIHVPGSAQTSKTFGEVEEREWLHLLTLNCQLPVALAARFGPDLTLRGCGGFVLVGSLAALAGGYGLAVYAGAKAFEVNFAEGLWAEWKPKGVDVCVAALGSVSTPAKERAGTPSDPHRDMTPERVAEEILANITNGPTHVVGEDNRAMASQFWPDRRAAVEAISAGARAVDERS